MDSNGDLVQPTREGFEDTFKAREYLDEYFGAGLNDEDVFTARFLGEAVSALPDGLLAHEFGGGPALYSVAALALRAREIHFSDAVQDSLDEVQHWIDGGPGIFDWKPYVRLALEYEGTPVTEENVARREADMRRKLTRLMICDAQAADPLLGNGIQYDLVAANHCTDVAATTVDEWYQVMKNVATLVKPGGWLIILVTTGSRVYTVHGRHFKCADLSVDNMRAGFVQAGFDPESLNIQTHHVDVSREYNGIIAAIGKKI